MWVLMMRTLYARSSERVNNSFAHVTAVDARLVALCLLTVGLLLLPSRADAQTASQAFINLFSGARLYVDPSSAAKRQADAWRRSLPSDAQLMDKIAAQPVAQWLGGWNVDIGRDVADAVSRITGSRALPVFVAYNIPGRDCGEYSAGGANGSNAYKKWIRSFANGIGNRKAVVILEPDALAGVSCLSPGLQQERVDLIHDAVRVLRTKGAAVYIDAGHARWVAPQEIASRLKRAGIAEADGFSLNISNFLANSVNIAYGTQVSKLVGGKHFIIDTGRNVQNDTKGGYWFNPTCQRL